MKKYYHADIEKVYTRKRPTYFVIGSAVHKFIEVYYTTQGNQKLAKNSAEAIFKNVDTGIMTADEIHNLEVDKHMVLGICEAYPKFYEQDFQEYTTFLTEQSFSMKMSIKREPSKDIHEYRGYIDLIVQDAAGEWWVFETKTASAQALNKTYFDKVHIDSQVLGYMHAAKEIIGEFPKGVIYNTIKKPGIRLRKGESKGAYQKRVFTEYDLYGQQKQYFQRKVIEISRKELSQWKFDALAWMGMVSNRVHAWNAKGEGRYCWPKNTGSCSSKFGACEYLSACITGKYSRLLYESEKTKLNGEGS